MPATQTVSMIVRRPKAPVAPQAANNFPETPVLPENGKKVASAMGEKAGKSSAESLETSPISFHAGVEAGTLIAPDAPAAVAGIDDLVSAALRKPKRGRPAAFDDHAKGKLVAMLALGLSLRQAASQLGVSHTTVRNTLKADPALAEEINAARFEAQVQPLGCVIRESQRSWKAATWLIKYLEGKISNHEETVEEREDRQRREEEEMIES